MRLRNPILVMILAIFLIVLVGWTRGVPKKTGGVLVDQFWAEKYSHSNDTDIVLAGCSRVLLGLSPQTIANYVHGVRILNFGFLGTGYGTQYLDAIDRVLDRDSKKKVVILGIAPHNFIGRFVNNNDFLELEKQSTISIWLARYSWIASINQFTKPLDFSMIRTMFLGRGNIKQASCSFDRFHKNGWKENESYPEDDTVEVANYTSYYMNEKVSNENIKRLLDQVRFWRRKGVRVYGLRLPTSTKMRKTENKLSGFNEISFINKFQKAGARWIPVEMNGYHNSDGSHLQASSSVKLSKLVGEYIRKDLIAIK